MPDNDIRVEADAFAPTVEHYQFDHVEYAENGREWAFGVMAIKDVDTVIMTDDLVDGVVRFEVRRGGKLQADTGIREHAEAYTRVARAAQGFVMPDNIWGERYTKIKYDGPVLKGFDFQVNDEVLKRMVLGETAEDAKPDDTEPGTQPTNQDILDILRDDK